MTWASVELNTHRELFYHLTWSSFTRMGQTNGQSSPVDDPIHSTRSAKRKVAFEFPFQLELPFLPNSSCSLSSKVPITISYFLRAWNPTRQFFFSSCFTTFVDRQWSWCHLPSLLHRRYHQWCNLKMPLVRCCCYLIHCKCLIMLSAFLILKIKL